MSGPFIFFYFGELLAREFLLISFLTPEIVAEKFRGVEISKKCIQPGAIGGVNLGADGFPHSSAAGCAHFGADGRAHPGAAGCAHLGTDSGTHPGADGHDHPGI